MKYEIKIDDQAKLKVVFETYFKAMVNYAMNYIDSLDVGKDIAQETFIRLWEKKIIFSSDSALRAFLYTSVRNNCLNRLKHQKVKDIHAKEFISKLSEEKFNHSCINQNETARYLYISIEQLTERRKEVIKLTLKGYRNQQIAEQLGIKLQTVKTLKSQAYQDLRSLLRNYK